MTNTMDIFFTLLQERNVFYPLAEAGSRVYFVLMDIVKINWMYQFSLKSFLHLFQRALDAPHVSIRSAFLVFASANHTLRCDI